MEDFKEMDLQQLELETADAVKAILSDPEIQKIQKQEMERKAQAKRVTQRPRGPRYAGLEGLLKSDGVDIKTEEEKSGTKLFMDDLKPTAKSVRELKTIFK